jgi:Zn-dependent metalloprotease
MYRIFLLLAALCLLATAHAQPSLQALENRWKKDRKEGEWQVKLSAHNRGTIRFAEGGGPAKASGRAWIAKELGLRQGNDDLAAKGTPVQHKSGVEVERLQQWFKGIEVAHGTVHISSKEGKVAAMQVEFYAIADNFSTTPSLGEAAALQAALTHIGADRYAWQDNGGKKPAGTLVIVEDFVKDSGTVRLAYRFDIAATRPLSRSQVFVDAHNGKLLLINPLIKHFEGREHRQKMGQKSAPQPYSTPEPMVNMAGSAATRYSGTIPLITDNGSAVPEKPFRLHQARNGHGIVTLNHSRTPYDNYGPNFNTAFTTDFVDDDNNWTAAEHSFNYDDAALDVHLAMQYISDYWKGVHNRASWDNAGSPMYSFIHVRDPGAPNAGFDNAFWDGAAMWYGDGSYFSTDGTGTVANPNGYKPLTSLDVSAHELGHAVCQATADLVYRRESGALNEGFSDIWAACVEAYAALGKNSWLVGEEITGDGYGLRNMQQPKLYGYPDTYGGTNWWTVTLGGCTGPVAEVNDYCGVHINSSVLNKWFYLITQGASAANDLGSRYSVSGLGFARSQAIAYLTELNLTPNATFADAREMSIAAASLLYGACSNEVVQVTNAWFAVGVGATASCLPVVEFTSTATTVTEGAGLAGSCSDTRVPIQVKLAAAPSTPAEVVFSFGGTAVKDVDYTVAQTTIPFSAAGVAVLDIYLKNNATAGPNKSIVISYSVNNNGGNAAVSGNNFQHTVTLVNDDAAPQSIAATPIADVVLVQEAFDASLPGTTFPAGWQPGAYYSGGNSVNRWVIGSGGGAGISGNAAYISNTSGTVQDFAYNALSATDRLLILPQLRTTGLKNVQVSFQYKVGGEFSNIGTSSAELWDYARVVWSTNGTTYYPLNDPATGAPLVLFGDGSSVRQFSATLPATLENMPAVYLALRWTNDAYAGNGIPVLIDNVLVKATRSGASIETQTAKTNEVNILAGAAVSFIATDGGKNLVARIANASTKVDCLSAGLVQSGTGMVPLQLGGKSFMRSSKVVALKPAVPNAATSYTATIYFTTAELAGWPAAEIANLKILKVKDGVDLSGPISEADAQLVVPAVEDRSAAAGYYAFTGTFNGFSQFMLVSQNSVLPVQLVQFDAVPAGAAIKLDWKTENEQHNQGFWVERSSGGNAFEKLAWIPASGNSAGRYGYLDAAAKEGVLYTYRLQQQDVDGRGTYSPYRSARRGALAAHLVVAPNPASSFTEITLPSGAAQHVWLTDSRGNTVRQWQQLQGGARHRISLQGLAPGLYLLRVGGELRKLVVR